MGDGDEAEADGVRRRRRRRRAARPEGPPRVPAAPDTAPAPTAPAEIPPPPSAAAKPPRKRRPARDAGIDRGLRDLVGAGRSQLGVDGALRARDVNRPTGQDLADAERDVVIVRRNWTPSGPS